MKHPLPTLSIGAVAASAGVNVETIRFYQRKGLLPEPTRSYGQIRRYGGPDVARVKFVKSAQRLGFSLEEIAGLLRLEDGTHCDDARVMAEQKLEDVRAKLRDLRRMESVSAQTTGRGLLRDSGDYHLPLDRGAALAVMPPASAPAGWTCATAGSSNPRIPRRAAASPSSPYGRTEGSRTP